MKTRIFGLGLLSLLAILILLQSCNSDSENELTNDKEVSQNYKGQLISGKTAQALGDNYLGNNYAVLSSTRSAKELSREDARQVIYPIEVLQGYIDYVKTNGGENSLIGVNLGQYPTDKAIDSRQKVAYKGYQTMYLMSYKSINNTVSQISGMKAMNHGSIIPPDEPTSAISNRNFKNYIIEDEAASILYDTYTRNNEKMLHEQGVEVQRQYLYKIDVLEGYLQYIKTEAEKKGIKEVNISINIGQAPFDISTASKGKQKAGGQCIYFTAFPSGSDMKNKSGNLLNGLSALK